MQHLLHKGNQCTNFLARIGSFQAKKLNQWMKHPRGCLVHKMNQNPNDRIRIIPFHSIWLEKSYSAIGMRFPKGKNHLLFPPLWK